MENATEHLPQKKPQNGFAMIPLHLLDDLFSGDINRIKKALVAIYLYWKRPWGNYYETVVDRYGNRMTVPLNEGEVVINISEITRRVRVSGEIKMNRDTVRRIIRKMEKNGEIIPARRVSGQNLAIYRIKHPNEEYFARQNDTLTSTSNSKNNDTCDKDITPESTPESAPNSQNSGQHLKDIIYEEKKKKRKNKSESFQDSVIESSREELSRETWEERKKRMIVKTLKSNVPIPLSEMKVIMEKCGITKADLMKY
jgi:hypothetical protein